MESNDPNPAAADRRPVRVRRATVHALLLGVAAALVSPRATSQENDACTTSYVESQKLRKQGKLKASREHLLVCASASCSGFIQSDCAGWLGELDAQMPSIVIVATGLDGKDTAQVEVRDGGVVVASSLDGRPILLDPGPHELEMVHPGAPARRQSILVREGEKSRRVEVSFAKEPPAVGAPAVGAEGAPPRALGISGIVIGGVGLAALGAFVGLAVTGTSDFDELDRTCGSLAPAPATGTCSEEDVSAVKRTLTIADVFLGAGAGLAALGATLLIVDFATAPDGAANGRVVAGPDGVSLTVRF